MKIPKEGYYFFPVVVNGIEVAKSLFYLKEDDEVSFNMWYLPAEEKHVTCIDFNKLRKFNIS